MVHEIRNAFLALGLVAISFVSGYQSGCKYAESEVARVKARQEIRLRAKEQEYGLLKRDYSRLQGRVRTLEKMNDLSSLQVEEAERSVTKANKDLESLATYCSERISLLEDLESNRIAMLAQIYLQFYEFIQDTNNLSIPTTNSMSLDESTEQPTRTQQSLNND